MLPSESAGGIEQGSLTRHVSRIPGCLSAGGANLFRRRQASRGVNVDKPNGHAVLREPDGYCTPQPTSSTRDQNSLLRQLSDG
jgi:hypothetical protein